MAGTIEDIFGIPFSDSDYPEGFLTRFERETEVLSCTKESCVCVIREKASGRRYTARYVYPFIDENGTCPSAENGFAGSGDLNRAYREYTVLNALNHDGSHPGIPSDPGWYPGKVLSISVHRFAEGMTLEKFAERGGLNRKGGPDSIFRSILSAAENLHSHTPAAVHLDIKPENIIIGPDETVTFIDFESALILDPDGSVWGGSHGTRPYAAPEQFTEPFEVDVRTDIHALGVLLRFVCTGSPESRTDRPLREKLGAVVEKCTRPDAKDRYPSVRELSAAFEKAAAGPAFRFPVFAAVLAAAVFAAAGFLFFLSGLIKADSSAVSEAPVTAAAAAGTEPAVTELTVTGQAETEPVLTKQTETEPAVARPAETEMAVTELTVAEQTETEPALTKQTETEPAVARPAETEMAVTEPAETEASGNSAASEEVFYVYRDFGSADNHFHEKMQMQSPTGVIRNRMDENRPAGQDALNTCIRCEAGMEPFGWCGFCFLNGIYDEGRKTMKQNDGTTAGQGVCLTGAKELRFLARGEEGGEQAEFFCCGFGYDGENGTVLVPYPDSEKKRSAGILELSSEWQEYCISLSGACLENISCGFGYAAAGGEAGKNIVFYLDEIRFIY